MNILTTRISNYFNSRDCSKVKKTDSNSLSNVAICLSGYFNSKQDLTSKGVDGYKHLHKHVLSKANCDVFIHSWDLENKQQILDLYGDKLKGCLFEPQIDFKPLETLPKPRGRVAQSILFSQFYSLQKSFELLKLNNKVYDSVIKTRFDVGRINRNSSGPHNLKNPYPVQCINFNPNLDMANFYMANWQYLETEGPADMWFYSSHQNMIHFADIFNLLLKDMVKGSEMESWATQTEGGFVNGIKSYKWFLIKKNLWQKKVCLDTTWE